MCTLKKKEGEKYIRSPQKCQKQRQKTDGWEGKKQRMKRMVIYDGKKEAEKSRRRLKEERHARRPFSAYIEKKGECNMNAA